MKLDDVLKEIERQLASRGTNGKPQGYIVLTREQAETLLRLPKELDEALNDGLKEFLDAVARARD
jgi:hypothetical protein